MDDAWVRANSERKRGLLLSNAVDDAPQHDVGRGSSERTRCSDRRLQRALLPVTSEPRRNRKKKWIEPLPQAKLGPDYIWEAVSAFLGLKEAPRAWDTCSANVLTNSMQMEQSQDDGCLFYRLGRSRERTEEKAGRHIDDFLVTGPEPNVERFLEQARGKLNMQDAVRLQNRRRR